MSTRKGKWVFLILAVCLCWGGITGCGEQARQQEILLEQTEGLEQAEQTENIKEAKEAEQARTVFGEFRANDIEYREVTQDIFSVCDVTMVYIWATFSEECMAELEQLAEISARYQMEDEEAQKPFQIVGIPIDTLDQSGSASSVQLHEIRNIMKQSQADFVQIIPSYSLIVSKLKEVTELPEILFVDKEGYQVGESQKGFAEERNWSAMIEQMIEAVQ